MPSVDGQEREEARGEDVAEAVPHGRRQEDLRAERVAGVVAEARQESEGSDEQLEVARRLAVQQDLATRW